MHLGSVLNITWLYSPSPGSAVQASWEDQPWLGLLPEHQRHEQGARLHGWPARLQGLLQGRGVPVRSLAAGADSDRHSRRQQQ